MSPSLHELIQNQRFAKRNISLPEKAIIYMHKHPTLIKTLKLGSMVLGSIGFMYPLLNKSFTYQSLSLATCSFSLFSVGCLAHKVLNIIAPPKHSMKHHLIKTATTRDAQIYYKGDIPILKITTSDPYRAGFAHGKLLAENINKLRNSYQLAMQTLPPLMPFIHTTPKVAKLQKVIQEVKKSLPEKYIKEMQGIVDGYNAWAKTKYFFVRPKPLTLEEVILLHLEPDVPHFKHLQTERNLNKATAACSAIVDKEKDGKIVFGRMMDWPTLGNPDTVVILKQDPETKIKTAEVSIPGTVFTLSGMNEHGLSLCMNICYGNTTSVNGLPNALITKLVLSTAKTSHDVKTILNKKRYKPLGPFHLICADPKKASAFFLKQHPKNHCLKESLRETPIVVTNLSKDPTVEDNVNFAKEREGRIQALFEFAKKYPRFTKEEVIKECLQLPYVNNILSAHRIVMIPEDRSIELSFDTAYAGTQPMQKLTRADLF
ncbi:MAG: hypothetical protein K1060chlam5_00906 [Candidatus Anoxychlamydiales bacterium]|nr:hypothetical protein [Candidatus Anoxychlamydiales bacterium]